MMCFALALLLTQAHDYVIEDVARDGVVVFKSRQPDLRIPVAPNSAAKQGWSFDADSRCNLVIIERAQATSRHEDPRESKLAFRPAISSDGGASFWFSTAGFSSPTFSPDGGTLLVIRGRNELARVSVADGGVTVIGSAWFAFWGVDGNITSYERLPGGCHLWRRLSPSGALLKESQFCGGYSSAAIGGGVAPAEAPVLVLDGRWNVIALVGQKTTKPSSSIQLSTAERGLACPAGIDFVSEQGTPITLNRIDDEWVLHPGESCSIPIESRRGRTKVVECY